MSELNLDTIRTMLQNSNCTTSDLAAEFDVPLNEMIKFFVDNELQSPSALNGAGDHSHRFLSSMMPETEVNDSKHVVLDYTNGLPYGLMPKDLNPTNIVLKFHGRDAVKGMRCPFCGRYETEVRSAPNDNDMLFNFVDNDPSNFLVTNIEPCCRECIVTRFADLPLATEKFIYIPQLGDKVPSRARSITIELTIMHRPDLKTGYVCNKFYLDELFTKWIEGQLNTGKAMLDGIPYTPSMIAIWAYRQLTEFGLLKGLVNVRVVGDSREAEINGAFMHMHYTLITQNIVQQQKQASGGSGSGLIAPGTPENLGRAKNLVQLHK